jgi:cytidine deaminase
LSHLDPAIQKIINKAKAVREKAYCPYSKFAVGAALLCDDGAIIDGCNVENVSYGLTICAERSAICKAMSEGQKVFNSIAICAEMKDKFVGPCGACRQVI